MVVVEVVAMTDQVGNEYDVVVVGGGAAGLSGALMLARARRSVVVIDAGTPRNAPADGVHGLLARDGMSPTDLLATGRSEVRRYGGQVVTGEATTAAKADGGFTVALADGRSVHARRLLVTTGLVDELPDVPGLRERWGRDVVHCPYCHGWEVRDQAIGVLATGPFAVHQALLFRQWSADVILFTHTTAPPSDAEAEQLAARGISVVPGEVESLVIAEDRLVGVRLRDGGVIARQAVTVMSRMRARSGVLTALGLTPTTHPAGVGEYIAADPTGLTDVPGVWVAGNVTDLMAQVGGAAAAGAFAAAAINNDLITEDTERAVAAHRDLMHGKETTVSEHFGEAFWNERYSSHTAVWSGRPNAPLVAETTELAPGTALDVGCGEGADAIWLAERGWQVTAVDFATAALERAAKHAVAAGVADRVSWVHADLHDWTPDRQFDLVSSQFIHFPLPARQALFRRMAAAVAPGGTLLITGHHPSDLETDIGRPPLPDLFFTPEELAADLAPDQWEILVAEARPRAEKEVAVRDTVLRARRR